MICGDFNTIRFVNDRRSCNRITKGMIGFLELIEDMELFNPPLNGGIITGAKDYL